MINNDDITLLMEAEAFLGEKLKEAELSGDGFSAVTMDGLRIFWKFNTTIKEIKERLNEVRRKQKEMLK